MPFEHAITNQHFPSFTARSYMYAHVLSTVQPIHLLVT